MTDRTCHIAKALALVSLALLGACSSGSKGRPEPSAAVAPVAQGDIDAIVLLLDAGNTKAARKQLAGVLKREPLNAEAQLLLDSIDRDPKELLGPTSYAYTVQPGETMTALAQRLLGNRLKFYQLARYNAINVPASLVAGQVLRIPGTPPRPVAPKPEPRAESPRPAPQAPAAAKPKPAPAKPTANPVAARQARAAGLTALNKGDVTRAVTLLRRAAALDPGNAVIARDLQRAQRIAATVRARKP